MDVWQSLAGRGSERMNQDCSLKRSGESQEHSHTEKEEGQLFSGHLWLDSFSVGEFGVAKAGELAQRCWAGLSGPELPEMAGSSATWTLPAWGTKTCSCV